VCVKTERLSVEFVRERGALWKVGDGHIHRLSYLRLLTMKSQQFVSKTSVTPIPLQITHNYISNEKVKFRHKLYTYTGNIHTCTLHTL